MISARSEETDKIRALDMGADDYLTKPFSTDELMARIRASREEKTTSSEKKEKTNKND